MPLRRPSTTSSCTDVLPLYPSSITVTPSPSSFCRTPVHRTTSEYRPNAPGMAPQVLESPKHKILFFIVFSRFRSVSYPRQFVLPTGKLYCAYTCLLLVYSTSQFFRDADFRRLWTFFGNKNGTDSCESVPEKFKYRMFLIRKLPWCSCPKWAAALR